ncbi:MAG: dehydratase [Blastococcus sp.]|jgi:acyl dehydratase|nr:dehydratase [Blastococcus sp.]
MDATWADLAVGQEFRTATRTVTEADVVGFASLTGDFSEVHVSESFAQGTQFGQRIAHGLLGLSYAQALMVNPGTFRACGIAFLGIDSWRFRQPILFGDTIHAAYVIAELRPSRTKPRQGIMGLDVRVINQHGAVVQSGRQSLLMSMDPLDGRSPGRDGTGGGR